MTTNERGDSPLDGETTSPDHQGDRHRFQTAKSEPAPYIPASANLREFTLVSFITGTIMGVIFGASSLYLVLKVGMTVSASIPVAVISITLFGVLSKIGFRNTTILENNIIQTTGSAGESIAGGIGITMPAILILGFDLEITRVILVSLLGGALGILMMIPLRRALIIKQHGVLKYPEGTACAEILMAGASDESRRAAQDHPQIAQIPAEGENKSVKIGVRADGGSAEICGPSLAATKAGGRTVFAGFGIGAIYMLLMQVLKGWKEIPARVFGAPFGGASVTMEVSPALLGVGYIIGPRVASVMCAGGVLAYLVLIPAIKFFGGVATGLLPTQTIPIADMDPGQIRGNYILYIGAGAVASAGIISLFRSLPIIWHSLAEGLRDLRAAKQRGGEGENRRRGDKSSDGRRGDQHSGSGSPSPALPVSPSVSQSGVRRTDKDISMKFVILGIVVLTVAILLFKSLQMNLLGAILIIGCGFLFVTVSSRVVGQIGSSPNPISGMTVATLLITCLIFVFVGWVGPGYYVTALSVGAIVCIAAANAGATSQDLKTGYLIGATPRLQQIAILVGSLTSALVIGLILMRLNTASTVYVPQSGMHTDVSKLVGVEKLQGPQAASDGKTYHVWQKRGNDGGAEGRYLVDDQGDVAYLVDPGINGTHKTRPDGSAVTKYDSPKAVLMSYIIKGILSRELPWGLVLLGVMLTVVLELAGVPSLPFAVGVYLPLSTSSPILIGGLVRRLVEWRIRKRGGAADLPPEVLAAQADKGPGVLMASGYVAGGAIAGIVIAFMAGVLGNVDQALEKWSKANNPAFAGPWADLLPLIPFALLAVALFIVGRSSRDQAGN